MRQIGSLSKGVEAQRLAAYLVTEGIAAHAEEDGEEWAIWVRDENQLEVARDAFRDFRGNPDDPRYRGVERSAAAIREEELRQREAARKNVVEMRGKWSRGGAGMATPKRSPLVFVLIVACVGVSLWTKSINGERATQDSREANMLRFASREAEVTAGSLKAASFVDIKRGQVWRLITPIFPHIGALHLVMNLFWIYRFGSQIEHFKGTKQLALLVLATALIPNVAQATLVGPNFFGISGVVCGTFGYVWISSQYDPSSRLDVSRFTIGFFLVYLVYCVVGGLPVANVAHFAGLGVGAALAYAPIAMKQG